MLPKPINFLLIILLSTALANGARRKSKVNSPIALAADAPLSDNLATASGSEPQVAKEAAPAVAAEKQSSNPTISPASSSLANTDNEDECDTDLIGFEIITG